MNYSYALGEARAASANSETGSNIVAQHVSKSNSAAKKQKEARKLSVRRQVDEKQFIQWFKVTKRLMIIFLLVFLHILYNPINPDLTIEKN